MEQENKLTKKEVLKYFKDTQVFIKNTCTPYSEFGIRQKDNYVQNDLQLIGYIESLDISIAIKYDVGKELIYQLEIDGHTVINRNVNLNELYNYIFLLSDIIEHRKKLKELYSTKVIKEYEYAAREFKIKQLI